jgi:hypothetical protein
VRRFPGSIDKKRVLVSRSFEEERPSTVAALGKALRRKREDESTTRREIDEAMDEEGRHKDPSRFLVHVYVFKRQLDRPRHTERWLDDGRPHQRGPSRISTGAKKGRRLALYHFSCRQILAQTLSSLVRRSINCLCLVGIL